MKTMLIGINLIAVSAMTLFGQGRVLFNNVVSSNAITIRTFLNAGAGQGFGFVGTQYSMQLLWAPGTYADYLSFLAVNPSSSTTVAFFGTTGGSPTTDGAGLFDGGVVAIGSPGTYTMVARAWYNGGVFATWNASNQAQANVGFSDLFIVNVTAPPDSALPTIFPSFQVGLYPIPEPSTLALAGLGSVCLLLFHRRK